jgi:hypothetical protein
VDKIIKENLRKNKNKEDKEYNKKFMEEYK